MTRLFHIEMLSLVAYIKFRVGKLFNELFVYLDPRPLKWGVYYQTSSYITTYVHNFIFYDFV